MVMQVTNDEVGMSFMGGGVELRSAGMLKVGRSEADGGELRSSQMKKEMTTLLATRDVSISSKVHSTYQPRAGAT